MTKKISILGCGWLGLPLAEALVKEGFQVKGSTTRVERFDELRKATIEPFQVVLDPFNSGDDIREFLNSDLLIIDIPPALRKRSEDFHIKQMECVKQFLDNSPIQNVIYISSTSVYPELNREVVEEDVKTEEQTASKTLFCAEEIFRQNKLKATIVRCAGLAGYERNLVKHFAGKKDLEGGSTPVNLIHRDDVVEIIKQIISQNFWGHTINACSPIHPLRRDLYPFLAKKFGYELPAYKSLENEPFKIIGIGKLENNLSFQFKFPDPREFYYSL